ncbi:uncharacterized protein LOC103568535 [Microplitis demolitor]|uniref:uncharacterized protein LOC103568535 n=1 Tax=Microplitis demolitor TaxID=69319 RepID=UPI00235B6801|nr:uncharacterized protein LOC103568535 [Microplitis demolitor]
MSPVNVSPSNTPNYYLPHHAVIKNSSMTTKVRVVFDGSANTTTGVSLNDVLFTGPTIQSDLFSLLIRFREYPTVITGDIEKMYRQFFIRKEDRKYQRILWRNSNNEIQTYELDTVTFGIRTSPYLAIRCLHQLADDEGQQFPIAAKVLKEDFYVDDLLSGAEDVETAIKIRQQVTQILRRAGLTIRQWASNNSAVLKDIPQENINPHLQLGDSTLKTLGMCWESRTDNIIYTVKPIVYLEQTKITKRNILSEIAKIFDPLGLLAPVIILAKILIQKLWDAKLDWDESLPIQLYTEWKTYYTQLTTLNQVSFPRTIVRSNTTQQQLHGFCDASEKAYGACIYLRVTDPQGKIQVLLICAKSKVAPLKTITIPRLELCEAQLLSSLMKATTTASKMTFDNIHYWTDSTIVLNWLNTSPHQLKTFVSNRVSDIQTKTDVKSWRHVPTKDNPADLVSRGVLPADFTSMNIWKHGPSWLREPTEKWPTYQLPLLKEIPEQRRATCLVITPHKFVDLTRFSSYNRMIRSLVYCLRFGQRCKVNGPLTIKKLRDMEIRIIKAVQQQAFAKEIKELQESGTLTHDTVKIVKLTPKLDDQQIMRVGGRLSSSDLPYSTKHPIILPKLIMLPI